jgi:hypothetical protein
VPLPVLGPILILSEQSVTSDTLLSALLWLGIHGDARGSEMSMVNGSYLCCTGLRVRGGACESAR